jgi:autotransporter-associated beta strand protein
LTVSGSASLAGTLNLFGTTSGTEDLINYSSFSGSFATATGIPAGYKLQYTATALDLVLAGLAPSTWAAQSGSWNNSSNWIGGAATSGASAMAIVGTGTSTPQTITLDTPQTLGTLIFANSLSNTTGYKLAAGAAGSLTLNNFGSGASILVTSGSNVIDAPVVLADSAGMTVRGSTSGWTLGFGTAGGISGTGPLTMSGGGTLILSGSDTYSNGTIVNGGTLIAAASGALPNGTSLTVGAGATLILDSESAFAGPVSGSSIEPSSGEIAAVPEPGTVVLLLAAFWSAAIYCRFRRRLKTTV